MIARLTEVKVVMAGTNAFGLIRSIIILVIVIVATAHFQRVAVADVTAATYDHINSLRSGAEVADFLVVR